VLQTHPQTKGRAGGVVALEQNAPGTGYLTRRSTGHYESG
jgi:hypothetical protein